MNRGAALLVICAAPLAAAAPPAAAPAAPRIVTIRGVVHDRATGAPVAGAIVSVESAATAATAAAAGAPALFATDDAGAFEATLPAGRATVTVTAPWLRPARVVITAADGLALDVATDPADAAAGETIEVHDLAPTAPGQTRVDAALARAVPGGGDAAKVVQALPGVARPPAGSADLVVWGAAPRETRVFVDGVPVPALYHLGGYRAAVGNDLVGELRLTPAAFGPDRGGAIGGVVDVALADPAKLPAWRVAADVLDASASGRIELGPVTVAAAIRQSWLDRAIGLFEDPAKLAPNAPLPTWTDAQVVARAPLGGGVVATGWILGSLDALDRTLVSDDPATQTDERTSAHTLRAQVTLRKDAPDGWRSVTVWGGRDRTSYDLQVGLIPASDAALTHLGGVRAEQATALVPGAASLRLGLDLDAEEAQLARDGSLTVPAREGDIRIFGQPPGSDVAADRWHATTIDGAGYAALDGELGRVSGTLGARIDGWMLGASRLFPRVGATPPIGSQQVIFTADPRATVQVKLAGDALARIDAGRYHQARDPADTSAVFGTPVLGVEQAWHVTAGAQWRHAPLALEAAAYARWLDDLVARDPAVTPQLAEALAQTGTGRVLGVQLTARVVDWRGLSGWLGYTLSKSTRKDAPDQATRYFDHDQTNGLVAVAAWVRGPWSLGGRVRYATGEPRTAVVGAFFDAQTGRYEPIVGAHNGVRLPAFLAADARVERRFPHGAVYVELQNLTGRANAEEIIYNADFTQKAYLTSLPFLAIAGVRLEP